MQKYIEEPVEYVRGFADFLGCKIDLSKRPLIPRPETEFWAEKAIEDVKNRKPFGPAQGKILHILDMFAGSGCIGIAVLKYATRPGLVVSCDFAEKDAKLLEQIRINLAKNGVGAKSIVRQSDVFNRVRGKYDFIFANPPYVVDYRRNPSARLRAILRNRIQKSVLKYEPIMALMAGSDGLTYIRKFFNQAKSHLNKSGKIYMEFSPEQKKEIEKIILRNKYSKYKFCKDQYGKWRYVVIE